MKLLEKLGLSNSPNKEDFDEANQIVLKLTKYKKSEIHESYLTDLKEGLKNEEFIDNQGSKYYGLKFTENGQEGVINSKIVYPELGFVPTEDTDVYICDYHYYDESKDEFDIPNKRKIVVNELPSEEMDIEIAEPWSMVNQFDKYPEENIYVVKDEKRYLCNGYYYEFSG